MYLSFRHPESVHLIHSSASLLVLVRVLYMRYS
jgi:hypothetical protein